MLRLGDLPEHQRAHLEEEPDVMDGYLGPTPDPLTGSALLSWELYWRFLRPGTAPDHPVDPDVALRLHDRILGPPDDPEDLLLEIGALDSAYAEWRARKVSQGTGEIGRPSPTSSRPRPPPKGLR